MSTIKPSCVDRADKRQARVPPNRILDSNWDLSLWCSFQSWWYSGRVRPYHHDLGQKRVNAEYQLIQRIESHVWFVQNYQYILY